MKTKKETKKEDKENKENIVNEFEKEVFLNVPNSLTLLRLILGFVLVYLLLFTANFLWVLIIFIIAAVSDFFDGFFARRLNQKTKVGARLDQVVDRIFMVPIIIFLLWKFYKINHNMSYLLILCLTREIIGASGFVIRIVKNTDPYKVKFIGKVTTFVQSFAIGAIILAVIFPEIAIITMLAWILGVITGFVGILAGFDYLKDSLK